MTLIHRLKPENLRNLILLLRLIVQGSVEAVKQSLIKLSNDEVEVKVIHGGVGAINESDVILASTSNAIILGFNVKPDARAEETAKNENVDLRLYSVIYTAIDDIERAMKGMLNRFMKKRLSVMQKSASFQGFRYWKYCRFICIRWFNAKRLQGKE